jgi:hypothetical protein
MGLSPRVLMGKLWAYYEMPASDSCEQAMAYASNWSMGTGRLKK